MAEKIERVSTGVKGLDKLVQGGVPKGTIVLISGAPGTGKTILAMHAIAANLKAGKKCAYMCVEQTPEELNKQAQQLSLDLTGVKWLSAKDLSYENMLGKKPANLQDLIMLLKDNLKKAKAEVVALDSLNSLIFEDGLETRLMVKKLVEGLKSLNLTALITSELPKESEWFSRDTVSEFLVDGIICLHFIEGDEDFRTLSIPKMRFTKQKAGIYSMKITEKGITVTPD
jgi:KaiC/GvpD/RAD55 family RecA-like ATPase